MPADWPAEADDHADRRNDDSAPSRSVRPSRSESELPSRQEEYVNLRIAVSTEQATAAHQTTTAERAAAEKWDKDVKESRWMWSEYQRHWPKEARPPTARPDDPPGSWRGDGDRFLDPVDNGRVDALCDRIAGPELEKISAALRDVEAQDSDRRLVGFKDRLKGRDRIKEKVYDRIDEFGISPEEAVLSVSDIIRSTLEYRETHYTEGVWADIERLKEHGFELFKLKNTWFGEEYKGINSQWIAPDTGQRFEVQFHTHISFEAKQLTHEAYQRLRTHEVDEFEKMVLKAFGRKVSADVPIPLGAADIPDYPEGGVDAR